MSESTIKRTIKTMRELVLVPSAAGLYCPAGGFHIDPMKPVERAVITHAHADHARKGHKRYIATPQTIDIMRARIGRSIPTRAVKYDELYELVGAEGDRAQISLHSAGHVLGSAQVRIACNDQVWVHTGDFKATSKTGGADPSCAPFEPVTCDTFVTESTFALPIFDWPDPTDVVAEIIAWWQRNTARGVTSIIQAYSLGKAQRLLAMIRDASSSDIYVYRTIAAINRIYEKYGIDLGSAKEMSTPRLTQKMLGQLVLAPPQAIGQMIESLPRKGTAARVSIAAASGWMAIPRMRKMRNVNKAFVLSDHADWKGLLHALHAANPSRVMPIHGYTDTYADWLRTQGYEIV